MRYVALIAAILLASPARADREFLTGFEECSLGAYNYDCGGGKPCIFTAISGTNVKIVTEAEAGDSMTARANYCDHNSRSPLGDNRGKSCSSNSDCILADNSAGICTSHPGNDCWLEILAPDAGSSNQYVTVTDERSDGRTDVDMGSMSDAYLHFLFGVSGSIASDGGNIDVAGSFKATDGVDAFDAVGCRVELQRISTTQYRLVAKYGGDNGGADGKVYECSGGNASGNWCTPCDEDADCGRCALGSWINNGKVCTSNTDCGDATCTFGGCENDGAFGSCTNECTRYTADEAFCTASTFGSTPPLTVGRWYEIVLGDEYLGDGLHACRLWEGGLNRGSISVSEWQCAKGMLNCSTNADCPNRCSDYTLADDPTGAITCSTNGDCAVTCDADTCGERPGIYNIPVKGFYLGNWREAAVQGPYRLHFDDVILDDESPANILVTRIEDFSPNGDTGGTHDFSDVGCSATTHDECVDDVEGCADADGTGACFDGDTSYLQFNAMNGSTDTEDLQMTDLVTALATDEAELATDAAVALTAIVSDTGNRSAGSNKDVQLCMTDSSFANAQCGVTIDVSDRDATYVSDHYTLVQNAPAASATDWTRTNLASANARIYGGNTGTCVSNCNVRTTALVGQVDIEGLATDVPGVAQDVNNNGRRSLVVISDSTGDDLRTTLSGELDDYDDILNCTSGGLTIGDVENQWVDMLDGHPGGRAGCHARRGLTDKPADTAVLLIGINHFVTAPPPAAYCVGGTAAGGDCDTNTDCAGGTCEVFTVGYCRGGTEHGKPCDCGSNLAYRSGAGRTTYCVNNKDSGAVWLGENVGTSCHDCADASDCLTNIPCADDTDCGSDTCVSGECAVACVSGVCLFNGLSYAAHASAAGIRPLSWDWNLHGCPNTDDCPDGICLAHNSLATAEAALSRMFDLADARTNTGAACTNNGNCKVHLIVALQPNPTPGTVYPLPAAFPVQKSSHEAFNSLLRTLADARGYSFIDLSWRFRESNLGMATLYRDTIHWACPTPSVGCLLAQNAIEDCLENRDGTSDGECASSVCAAGKVGNACSSDADCDTYRCDFAP